MKVKMSLLLVVISLLSILPTSNAWARDPKTNFEPQTILQAMRKVNDYAVENPWRPYDRDWIRATMYTGVMEAYHVTGDVRYLEQAKRWAEKHKYSLGHERSGFNRMFNAMTWLELQLLEPNNDIIANIEAQFNEEKDWRPELGKIWYGHEPHANDAGWVYADSLYGAPAFFMLHEATGNQRYLDLIHEAFWNITRIIFDEEENLYYRDPTYIGNKSPNGGKIIWARGNGWVFAGLPRILKHLEKDDPYYEQYLSVYKKMAKSLASRQNDDGFWRANLDDEWHYRMPESSSTAFFTAGFAWGIKEGILDEKTYLPTVIKGWDALNRAVRPDGFMGWVQPVDAAPRPSHPKSTQEYAVGLFMYAGAKVYQLVEQDIITNDKIDRVLAKQSHMLPEAAFSESLDTSDHPAAQQINSFLKNQSKGKFKETGLARQDYLEVIASQVKAMSAYQNDAGRIIDPVDKVERYFTTPTYAHSVSVLAKANYKMSSELLQSGMKALDVALSDLAENTGRDHSDFFTWPVVMAVEAFSSLATEKQRITWKKKLAKLDRTKYHYYREPIGVSDHRGFYETYNNHKAMNWNLVNSAGEWMRTRHTGEDQWYVDYSMTMNVKHFTEYGMFNEGGNPLAYDQFARHYLTSMLAQGYRSYLHSTYRNILWRGAWTSLFTQSPFGESPTGYRSTHHIWNEAQQAVMFEVYASAYAKEGKMAQAGAFKRAAKLSLLSIKQWLREDGSGFAVKNRYPIEDKHGYERYTKHSCYNMLATSMLAQAWLFADDTIEEAASPADVGGYVLPITTHFRKIFANAAGNFIQYDTNGDLQYNPTGLLRLHLKDGHPQLGPSDGVSSLFAGEGVNLAVGPSWRNAQGKWTSLADYKGAKPVVEVLEESLKRTRLKVIYPEVTQTITIDKNGVEVEDIITAQGAESVRVSFPMLVSDGMNNTNIKINKNKLSLSIDDKDHYFTVLSPKRLKLQRSNEALTHRNGMVEEVFAEANGTRIVYKISAKR